MVLATNTSAIPITSIAAATSRPERVVGTHFFSPVPMMRLCELVRGYKTSDETLARARAFAESVGKTVIVVNRDVAGFVRTLNAEGVATIALTPSADAVPLREVRIDQPRRLLLFGSEREGLDAYVMSACTHCVRIEMQEGVDSLNVAAASAIACYALR